MFKYNLKNYTQKIHNMAGKDKLKILISPYVDWVILLSIFSSLLFIIAIVNIHFFIAKNIGKVQPIKSGNTENNVTLNEDILNTTIELFDKKAINFEKLSNEKPPAIDPSL